MIIIHASSSCKTTRESERSKIIQLRGTQMSLLLLHTLTREWEKGKEEKTSFFSKLKRLETLFTYS